MKRFFYTDPLAAAWMVRYHGLKVHGPVLTVPGERGISTRPMPVWVLARAIETAEKGFGPVPRNKRRPPCTFSRAAIP